MRKSRRPPVTDLVGAQPEVESTLLPQLLIEPLPLLGGVVERIPVGKVHGEARERGKAVVVQCRIILLVRFLFLHCQLFLSHGKTQVRCALEHRYRLRRLRRLLCDLDARGPRPNDCHALAGNIDAFIWPERRVMHFSLELLEPRPVWEVPLGSKTGATNEELCARNSAILSLDDPSRRGLVKVRVHNLGPEEDILLDIELFLDELEVLSELRVVWILLCPGPVLLKKISHYLLAHREHSSYLPELFDAQLIHRDHGIDSCAWVAVPMPETVTGQF